MVLLGKTSCLSSHLEFELLVLYVKLSMNFLIMKIPAILVIWFQRYQQLNVVKNNVLHKVVRAMISSLSNLMLKTSVSFSTITPQNLNGLREINNTTIFEIVFWN